MGTQTVRGRDELARALGVGMSEADLQREVIDEARRRGWKIVHFRPVKDARTGRWRTAYTGDEGFPDLVLGRGGVSHHWELKAEHGAFEPGQQEWVAALDGRVFRPADWASGEIGELLR